MSLEITGKHMDVGDALRTHIEGRIDQTLDKYLRSATSGRVKIEKEGGQFKTDCALHLTSGVDLQASGLAADPYGSADEAINHLEKRLRRYKRRLTKHHQNNMEGQRQNFSALDYTIAHNESEEDDGLEDAPIIIAENASVVPSVSVKDAVMLLDLAEQPIFVFRNAKHGRVNIVYKRSDGNIGWVDPEDK